ncbi:hypothetical protein HMPREF1129_2817 [Actinomyces naeslundii str. Howell 279]|uniref:Uncharacterized protein n=1 Tax=Actinomyces naeslundii (strain ATCC 12104 / DSM 43013 / CCUG 2238 / JCM 8349 / NCTC 10301 / Howell 279) TaxID=1115803 RepID=J2ZRX1_ACTNH|nr:hypothetical protein HMPREF1129_2817 [Actinomyces naeslundii str. Howell 279]
MPNSARHDPRLDAGYDAFGHHEHRSNAQREQADNLRLDKHFEDYS